MPDGRRPPLYGGNGGVLGTVLVDGFLAGTWRLDAADGDPAVLTVEPDVALPAADREAVEAEGLDLLRFTAPTARTHDVRVA